MGITTFQKRGFEADDLMATLTRHARLQNYPVHLITNDKDIHQLIVDSSPHVRQFSLNGKDMFDESSVKKKFGISPSQMIDYQAMVGDSVDNITEFKGGCKNCSKLLNHFTSLDDIFTISMMSRSPKFEGKIVKTMRSENALKARKLVRLLMM